MPDIDEDDSDETLTIRNCKFSYKCDKNWFELFDTKEKHIKIEEYVTKLMTEILNSFRHTFKSEKEFNIYI